jgi:hypothetical protein
MNADDSTQTTTVARSRERIISHAQERCHAAAVRYIEAANSLDDDARSDLAAAELHNAVIEYYRALRPLSGEDAVSDYWGDVTLWTRRTQSESGSDEEAAEVTGFDRLGEEAVRMRTVEEKTMGYTGSRTVTRQEPVRLPPKILLRIAEKLDEAAVKLGFAPETDDGRDKTYEMKKDPEDHDEPIDDSIPKPE